MLILVWLNFYIQPFQPAPAPVPAPLAGWMSTPSTVTHSAVSGGGAIGLGAPSIPGITFLQFAIDASANHLIVFVSIHGSLFNNICILVPCIAALKHPRTPPTNLSVDYPSGDSDHVAKRVRPMGISDEVVWFSCHSYHTLYANMNVASNFYTPVIMSMLFPSKLPC